MQDPQIGRWGGVDAMAEKFYHESPYLYAGNNPIFYIDKDGNIKYPADKESTYQSKYPLITKYLVNNFKNDVQGSTKIMKTLTGLVVTGNKEKYLSKQIQWGGGPEIEFSDNIGFPNKVWKYMVGVL